MLWLTLGAHASWIILVDDEVLRSVNANLLLVFITFKIVEINWKCVTQRATKNRWSSGAMY